MNLTSKTTKGFIPRWSHEKYQ